MRILHILLVLSKKKGGVIVQRKPNPYYPPYHWKHTYHPPIHQQPEQFYSPYNTGQYPTPYEKFAKPNQPEFWPDYKAHNNNQNYYPQAYISQQEQQQQEQEPAPSFLSQFQDANGTVDLDKMLSTVGQLANTVKQVSPVIQQVGSIIKSFR